MKQILGNPQYAALRVENLLFGFVIKHMLGKETLLMTTEISEAYKADKAIKFCIPLAGMLV